MASKKPKITTTEASVLTRNVQMAGLNLPPQVKMKSPEFMATFSKYILVEIHVGRKRLNMSLTLKALGIPETEKTKKALASLIRLGEQRLYPIVPQTSKFWNEKKPAWTYGDKLTSIETSARGYLESRATRFSTWGLALPIVDFADFDATVKEEYELPYMDIADELAGTEGRWAAHIREVKKVYMESALENAETFEILLRARNMEVTQTKAEFAQELWDGIEPNLPTAKVLRASFRFKVEYNFVDVSPWIDESARERLLSNLRENGASVAEMIAFETIYQRKKAEAEELGNQLMAEKAAFFNGLVYESLVDVLASMEKNNGALVGPVAGKVRTLWNQASSQVMRDSSDEAVIAERLGELATSDDLTANDIRKMMQQLATVTRSTLLQLNQEPRSARDFGIPDELDEKTVFQTRIALDMPLYDTESGELLNEVRTARPGE